MNLRTVVAKAGLHPIANPAPVSDRTSNMKHYFPAKKIFLLSAVLGLFTFTGCIVPEGERHEHRREEVRPEVRVESPELIVRPPEVIVR